MRKLLFLFTAIITPLLANADSFCIDGIYYNLITKANSKYVEVTSNPDKYVGELVIPEKVVYVDNTYEVIGIGEKAFEYCFDLTSVSIPNTVKYIGIQSFNAAWGITSIMIPNSVTEISDAAFANCEKLVSVTLGENVKKIGETVFWNCTSLTDINLPNSIESIGACAFQNCRKLVSITLPDNIKTIEQWTFYQCYSLESVTLPKNLITIKDAFLYTGLKSIEIPNSVEQIYYMAFEGCGNLSSVSLGDNIKQIGNSAFENCISLKNIKIPNKLTSISKQTFYGCESLTTISLHKGIKQIGDNAFSKCTSLSDVYCYMDVLSTEMKATAFDDSYIEQMTLHVPQSLTKLYESVEPWKNFGKIIAIDGGSSVSNVNAKAVIIKNKGGQIMVNGVEDAILISVYNINGEILGESISKNESAVVNTNLKKGSIAIVKVGKKKIKFLIE